MGIFITIKLLLWWPWQKVSKFSAIAWLTEQKLSSFHLPSESSFAKKAANFRECSRARSINQFYTSLLILCCHQHYSNWWRFHSMIKICWTWQRLKNSISFIYRFPVAFSINIPFAVEIMELLFWASTCSIVTDCVWIDGRLCCRQWVKFEVHLFRRHIIYICNHLQGYEKTFLLLLTRSK